MSNRTRNFPLPFAIALAAALLLLGTPTVSEAVPPGNTACTAKYVQSDADDTCRNETVTAQGWNCQVVAECKNSARDWVSSQITVNYNDVSNLNNCNGVLTNGSC